MWNPCYTRIRLSNATTKATSLIGSASPSPFYLRRGTFDPLPITGFTNTGIPGKSSCEELRYNGTVGVQKGFHLDDDLVSLAKSLDWHPLVDYSEKDSSLTFPELVEQTWDRFSGSAVWLPDYKVFFGVTRLIFYTGAHSWPVISFLRGQIFDKDWNHLDNYTLTWQGEDITFPVIYDFPYKYEKGGTVYGSEDPRIILEEGVKGAEPLVVFNMISERSDSQRRMWILRPFSNYSTMLTIRHNEENPPVEKNWAPFFHNPIDPTSNSQSWPSRHLHFVYGFKPLRILKCHLFTGYCDFVYKQQVPEELIPTHNDSHGHMRGGTNFVRVPLRAESDIRTYAAFPRTHIDLGCPNAVYRPELILMTSVGSHFYLTFASESVDFGTAALDPPARADPCGAGRILIANSISHWDRSNGQDVMTLSFSVDDSSVQVTRLHGLAAFIERLLHFHDSLKHSISKGGEGFWDLRWSVVGSEVLACSVEAATNYSATLQSQPAERL